MAITWRQEGLKRHRHRIDEAIQKLFVHEALPAIKQNRFYERHIDELVGRRVKLSARDLVALTLYGYHALKSRFEDRAELMPRIAFLLPNARELRTSVPLYDEVLAGTALMPPSLYLMERRALGEWREPEHYVQRLSSTFFFPPLAPEDFGCYYTYRLEDDPAEGPLYARFIQVDSLPPGSQQ